MPSTWDRQAEDLVVGDFPASMIATIRKECTQMLKLLAERLDRLPALLPFGREIVYSVSAAPPEDGRLRAMLAWACGPREPEWVWCWWEIDVWCWLDANAGRVLDLLPESGSTGIEVRTQRDVEAFVVVIGALRAVSEYRASSATDEDLCQSYESLIRFWNEFTRLLVQAATEPHPLPAAATTSQPT